MNRPAHDPTNPSDDLDRLLALDRGAGAPEALARRVAAGLRERDERALDALLTLARDDAAAPHDLARSVLARVEDERGAARARRGFRLLPGRVLPRVAAAALVLVLGAAAWRQWRPATPATPDAEVASATGGAPTVDPSAVDAELLELLPLLERWDLVTGDEDSVLDPTDLDTLAALDEDDELLLLLLAEENG